MDSWLGTEEDKEDFVMMSDQYISSTQLSNEDDIMKEKMEKEDDLGEGIGVQGVLTNQTLVLGGQEDPKECPVWGLEDGGDQEVVPEQTPSSSSTDSGVEEPTDSSLASVHHDGEEGPTNTLEGCSFEEMVFLDVSCSQGGDGTFDISRSNIMDTVLSQCPGD